MAELKGETIKYKSMQVDNRRIIYFWRSCDLPPEHMPMKSFVFCLLTDSSLMTVPHMLYSRTCHGCFRSGHKSEELYLEGPWPLEKGAWLQEDQHGSDLSVYWMCNTGILTSAPYSYCRFNNSALSCSCVTVCGLQRHAVLTVYCIPAVHIQYTTSCSLNHLSHGHARQRADALHSCVRPLA